MQHFKLFSTYYILFFLLFSCNKKSTDPTEKSNTKDNSFTIIVDSSSLTPSYNWIEENACNLNVVRLSVPESIVWSVKAQGQDTLIPPVIHGTVPTGAIVDFQIERILMPGVQYRVLVTLKDGQTSWSNFIIPINGFLIIVSSGVTPQYSWSIGDAFSVNVVRTDAPATIVWGIATPGQSNIASPLTHGNVPVGAVPTALGTPEAVLTAGVEYRVSVTKLDQQVGWADFTP